MRAIRVERESPPPLTVLWDHRDPFDGEDQPPTPIAWPWPGSAAGDGIDAVDAFGKTHHIPVRDGCTHLELTPTPLFLTPTPALPQS